MYEHAIWPSLLALVMAHLLAAAPPGPSFLFIARVAASQSRRAGIVAALGMSIGAGVWAAAALLGLAALFERAAMLYRIAQVAGGLYLVYIAFRTAQHANTPLPSPGAVRGESAMRTFLASLRVQLSNPKAAVFFGSIFITVMPRDASPSFRLASLLIVLVDEALWYSFVAYVLSTGRAQAVYGRFKSKIDKTTATVLGLFGVRLIVKGASFSSQ